LLCAAGAVGLVAALRRGSPPSPALWLLIALGMVTPLGALLYSLGPQSIYLPRNLIPSLPAVCLLAAAAALAPGGRLRWATTGAAAVALGIAAATTLSPDTSRAPYAAVARDLDRVARPGEPVVDVNLGSGALGRSLAVNFERRHPLYRGGREQRAALRGVPPGGRVFVVVPRVGPLARLPDARIAPRSFRVIGRRRYRGSIPLELITFRRARARQPA
jgi:hypothetical protein